jgi:hypothetical protein
MATATAEVDASSTDTADLGNTSTSVFEPDARWAQIADDVGVDPDEFDNEEDFLLAVADASGTIARQARADRNGKGAKPDSKPADADKEVELAVESYEAMLKGDDLDPGIVKEFARISDLNKKQTATFVTEITKLHKQHRTEVKSLRDQVGKLESHVSRANDVDLMDGWIRRNEEVQDYLGKGSTKHLDNDDQFRARRERLINKAYKLRNRALQDGLNVPSPAKLFDKALKAIHGKRSSGGTRTARPGGRSEASTAADKDDLSQEKRIERAVKFATQKQKEIFGEA